MHTIIIINTISTETKQSVRECKLIFLISVLFNKIKTLSCFHIKSSCISFSFSQSLVSNNFLS